MSLSFDIVTTKYPQVEESFSGQIGLSDRAAYGECVLWGRQPFSLDAQPRHPTKAQLRFMGAT